MLYKYQIVGAKMVICHTYIIKLIRVGFDLLRMLINIRAICNKYFTVVVRISVFSTEATVKHKGFSCVQDAKNGFCDFLSDLLSNNRKKAETMF